MPLPATARRYVRFGPYIVDFVAREVRNGSGKITLQDKPFQILAILLEQPGELVTREQLRERLWPADTYVDFDHSINTAIKKLREALEHDGDKTRYIKTLPKREYRFIGTVEEEPQLEPANEAKEDKASPVATPDRRRSRRRLLLYWAGVVVALLVRTGRIQLSRNSGDSAPQVERDARNSSPYSLGGSLTFAESFPGCRAGIFCRWPDGCTDHRSSA